MNLALTFKPEDFESMRTFEKAVKKQLGNSVYIGTDSLCVYYAFPKELLAMLRPYPLKQQLEFELVPSLPDQK